jgi:hypothetical protein
MKDKHQISERLDRFINLYGETWAKVFTFFLAGAVGTAFATLLIITFIQAAINIIAENN